MNHVKIITLTIVLLLTTGFKSATPGRFVGVVRQGTLVVVVRIKNGPSLKGELVRADDEIIELIVQGVSCHIKIDKSEVAAVIYPDETR